MMSSLRLINRRVLRQLLFPRLNELNYSPSRKSLLLVKVANLLAAVKTQNIFAVRHFFTTAEILSAVKTLGFQAKISECTGLVRLASSWCVALRESRVSAGTRFA
jgi:hypothetical protein